MQLCCDNRLRLSHQQATTKKSPLPSTARRFPKTYQQTRYIAGGTRLLVSKDKTNPRCCLDEDLKVFFRAPRSGFLPSFVRLYTWHGINYKLCDVNFGFPRLSAHRERQVSSSNSGWKSMPARCFPPKEMRSIPRRGMSSDGSG